MRSPPTQTGLPGLNEHDESVFKLVFCYHILSDTAAVSMFTFECFWLVIFEREILQQPIFGHLTDGCGPILCAKCTILKPAKSLLVMFKQLKRDFVDNPITVTVGHLCPTVIKCFWKSSGL